MHRRRPRDEKVYKNTSVPVSLLNPLENSRLNKRGESVAVLPLKNHCLQKESKHFKTFQKFNAHQSAQAVHSSDSPFSYICNICNKEFPIRSYLYQHLVTHDNERKHKCTMCTKVFKRLAGLNQHIRGYHYKIKPHVCTVCKHSYALKGDMRRCRHSSLQNKT